MTRRLFNFASVLSLLLCFAAAALWVRSYWVRESWLHISYKSSPMVEGQWDAIAVSNWLIDY